MYLHYDKLSIKLFHASIKMELCFEQVNAEYIRVSLLVN